MMLLTACAKDSVEIKTSPGVCDGLLPAIDRHADEILSHADQTHEDVILSGVAVIEGFDAGCEVKEKKDN